VRSLAQPALRPLSASLPPPDSQSGGVPAAAEQSLPAGPDAKPPPAAAGGEFGQPGGAGGAFHCRNVMEFDMMGCSDLMSRV